MMPWHPLRFLPIYQERIWGDRSLAHLYHRSLPGSHPIGESWEITDRPEGMSLVAEGPLQGRSLAQLLADDPTGLLGQATPRHGRFPLLVKILAAKEILSVQVHPPDTVAPTLHGEPKTEMWYFTSVQPGAEILAGLRPGTTRAAFEQALQSGTVDQCLHHTPVQVGDAMFLPSGRVHALGSGLVLFEIQENSDTTYRVFDWNRPGLDGQPRPLHIHQSLASINFQDFAPPLIQAPWIAHGPVESRFLVQDSRFHVHAHRTQLPTLWSQPSNRCLVIGILQGQANFPSAPFRQPLGPGDFCLLPAALRHLTLEVAPHTEWLTAEPGPHPHPHSATNPAVHPPPPA